jgi:hypothetical protein
MPSSGMLRRVAFLRTDVSEDPIPSIMNSVSNNWYFFAAWGCCIRLSMFLVHRFLVTPIMEALCSSETSVITRAGISSQRASVESYT